jgi:hypothetical protein
MTQRDGSCLSAARINPRPFCSAFDVTAQLLIINNSALFASAAIEKPALMNAVAIASVSP